MSDEQGVHFEAGDFELVADWFAKEQLGISLIDVLPREVMESPICGAWIGGIARGEDWAVYAFERFVASCDGCIKEFKKFGRERAIEELKRRVPGDFTWLGRENGRPDGPLVVQHYFIGDDFGMRILADGTRVGIDDPLLARKLEVGREFLKQNPQGVVREVCACGPLCGGYVLEMKRGNGGIEAVAVFIAGDQGVIDKLTDYLFEGEGRTVLVHDEDRGVEGKQLLIKNGQNVNIFAEVWEGLKMINPLLEESEAGRNYLRELAGWVWWHEQNIAEADVGLKLRLDADANMRAEVFLAWQLAQKYVLPEQVQPEILPSSVNILYPQVRAKYVGLVNHEDTVPLVIQGVSIASKGNYDDSGGSAEGGEGGPLENGGDHKKHTKTQKTLKTENFSAFDSNLVPLVIRGVDERVGGGDKIDKMGLLGGEDVGKIGRLDRSGDHRERKDQAKSTETVVPVIGYVPMAIEKSLKIESVSGHPHELLAEITLVKKDIGEKGDDGGDGGDSGGDGGGVGGEGIGGGGRGSWVEKVVFFEPVAEMILQPEAKVGELVHVARIDHESVLAGVNLAEVTYVEAGIVNELVVEMDWGVGLQRAQRLVEDNEKFLGSGLSVDLVLSVIREVYEKDGIVVDVDMVITESGVIVPKNLLMERRADAMMAHAQVLVQVAKNAKKMRHGLVCYTAIKMLIDQLNSAVETLEKQLVKDVEKPKLVVVKAVSPIITEVGEHRWQEFLRLRLGKQQKQRVRRAPNAADFAYRPFLYAAV